MIPHCTCAEQPSWYVVEQTEGVNSVGRVRGFFITVICLGCGFRKELFTPRQVGAYFEQPVARPVQNALG